MLDTAGKTNFCDDQTPYDARYTLQYGTANSLVSSFTAHMLNLGSIHWHCTHCCTLIAIPAIAIGLITPDGTHENDGQRCNNTLKTSIT